MWFCRGDKISVSVISINFVFSINTVWNIFQIKFSYFCYLFIYLYYLFLWFELPENYYFCLFWRKWSIESWWTKFPLRTDIYKRAYSDWNNLHSIISLHFVTQITRNCFWDLHGKRALVGLLVQHDRYLVY